MSWRSECIGITSSLFVRKDTLAREICSEICPGILKNSEVSVFCGGVVDCRNRQAHVGR